jgi:hypothetical protein
LRIDNEEVAALEGAAIFLGNPKFETRNPKQVSKGEWRKVVGFCDLKYSMGEVLGTG